MSNKKTARNLTTLIILFPLIALLVYGGSSYLFFYFTQEKDNQHTLKAYEKTLIDIEKERLKEKVNSLSQFIRYYDSKSSDKIKADVKNIVRVSVDVANNIYDTYKGKKSDKAIQKLIISALNNIHFEGDIGYLFMLNLKGDTLIHVDKKLVGTNILNIQDIHGKYIVKEFNKILKQKGEGYVDYYWYIVHENKKTMHYKISFVKMIKCYDWYIGAGEYLKYMKRYIKEDILNYIRTNAHFTNGHFLLMDADKNILFAPDSNLSTNKQPTPIEGFHIAKKYISYTQYIKEYNWYLVAQSDKTIIQTRINENKKLTELKRYQDTKTNLYLLGFSWIVSLLLSIYLSIIINRLLKNYERQIQQSNEKLIFQSRQALIGELFSMIAHQWRQPVNKIASILALLRFDLKQSEMVQADNIDAQCEQIENSIEFMSETIDDFRTFYHPKTSSENVNLKRLIEQSLQFVDTAIEKKNIHIIKELEDVEYQLYQNEFVQVMLNIIKNAIDAIDTNATDSTIQIELQEFKESIHINVLNSGTLIDEELAAKVFDPYFSTKKESMGLGLYMAKIIIEKHMKGSIFVTNRDTMTCFSIILPL